MGKLITLTGRERKLISDVLVSRFPALGTDQEMNGADTVEALAVLHSDLNDPYEFFQLEVKRG